MDLDSIHGSMDADFVQQRFLDFDCEMDADSAEDIVCKLNAFATTFGIKNADLLDGLIAFMMNTNKTDVITMELLDDYEHQSLSKIKPSNQSFTNLHSTNLQNERAILREIAIDFDLPEDNIQCEEDGRNSVEDEFETFDDDKHYSKPQKSSSTRATTIQNLRNTKPKEVKSSWKGTSFLLAEDETDDLTLIISPALKMVTSPSLSFDYGHDIIAFDVGEVITEVANDESTEQEEQERSSVLVGKVFPSEGRILTFENACLYTQSRVITLDFEKIDQIALYPGKQLTVKCLIDETGLGRVQSVTDTAPLSMAPLGQSLRLPRLKIFIASGPFSLKDDSSIDPAFSQVVRSAITSRANALILIGPFISKNAQFSALGPNEAFSSYIKELSKPSYAHLRVLIVPSANLDLTAMPYFPTPPYEPDFAGLPPSNISFLPDPAVFELEGVRFAVTASEVLMHLSKHELYKSMDGENEDRMQRLISHIFTSKSLYPLFPSDAHLPFVLRDSQAKLQLTKRPHVLIAPSVLQPIVKVVDECVVVNPGRFVRGKTGGTYASMEIDLSTAIASSITGSVAPFSEVNLLAISLH